MFNIAQNKDLDRLCRGLEMDFLACFIFSSYWDSDPNRLKIELQLNFYLYHNYVLQQWFSIEGRNEKTYRHKNYIPQRKRIKDWHQCGFVPNYWFPHPVLSWKLRVECQHTNRDCRWWNVLKLRKTHCGCIQMYFHLMKDRLNSNMLLL